MFDFTTVETKPVPFTLPSLYAWLREQPPEWTYTWGNGCVCQFAQYAGSIGSNYSEVVDRLGRAAGVMSEISPDKGNIEHTHIGVNSPHTMGAAADRCRKAMEARG